MLATIPADARDRIIAGAWAEAKARRASAVPDVRRWIESSVTIEDPQLTPSIIRFELWPAQAEALDAIASNQQAIILKARQLGLSWLAIAYALWLCIYHTNQTVMVFSKDQDAANEIVRRARGMFARLAHKPATLTTDNVQQIGWANGSRIKSFAATEDAGSSFTASFIILDEFAKMRHAEALYTSVKPTIDDGGRIVIISTARGESNPFHRLWVAAVKHANSLHPVFLPWNVRPSRDNAWYVRVAADAISSAHHRQEYPADPSEAFQVIGEERFLPSMTLWDACRETLPALGAQEPCVVALDAGTHNDSFGLVVISRHPARHADVAIRYVQSWKPGGRPLNFQGDEDNPGPELVLRRMCGDKKYPRRYNVVCVTYDPYQLHDMAQRLGEPGEALAWWRPFSQGGDRLEADKQLYDLIINRRLAHDGHADLRAHIDNADRKPDPETRKLRLIKREQGLHIDLAVATAMAANVNLSLDI